MKKSKTKGYSMMYSYMQKKNCTVTKEIPDRKLSKTFAFQPFCKEPGFEGLSSLFHSTFTEPTNPVKKKKTKPQHKVS